MQSPFNTKHSSAIPYLDFKNYGWDIHYFINYCSLCNSLRAQIISEELSEKASLHNSQSFQMILNRLLRIVAENSGDYVEPNFDLEYVLRSNIRYIDASQYRDEFLVLPDIFRSEDDFRLLFEEQMCSVLEPENETELNDFPMCETRRKALNLQRQYHEQRKILCDKLSQQPEHITTQAELYDWARMASKNIRELEIVDFNLFYLETRLSELDSSAEFNAAVNTLYVCQGTIKCQRDHHNIICVTAEIPSFAEKPIAINVNYCTDCKMFFISYSEYIHYMAKYGVLITRIVMISRDGSPEFSDSLAEQSPLKLCGYSVSQEQGYSSTERQALLSRLLDNRIMTKPDIIRYLSWFIKMNGQRYGNELARKKWKADLDFVRKYDISSQQKQKVDRIDSYPGYHKI